MLRIFVTLCLVAITFATSTEFQLKDGQCPSRNSNPDFDPTWLTEHEWYILNFTDPTFKDECCSCLKVTYHKGDGDTIDSHRFGVSKTEMSTNSRFIYEGTPGKYSYEHEVNGVYKPTGMVITFYFSGDKEYLVAYGCLQRDDKYANVALLLNGDRSAPMPPFFKEYLEGTGLDNFYGVHQIDC